MSFNRKKNRKREREMLQSLESHQHDSEDEVMRENDGKTILFQNNDVPLILSRESNYYTYGKTDCDEGLINAAFFWHQIIIQHQKKLDVKTKVLPEIYKIVGDDLFAPIAYRSSRDTDYFFLHSQGAALRKLFESELRVFMDDGQVVNLVVKFCVSKFTEGMLSIPNKLSKIIHLSMDKSTPNVINLSSISSHQELTDVKFTLKNQGCFQLLIDNLCERAPRLQNVKGLNLSNNRIASLKPLSKLIGFSLNTLDLRYNDLSSFEEFSHLKHLNLHKIFLTGNSITNIPMYREKIKSILPTLKTVDSTDVETSVEATVVDNRSEPIKFFHKNIKVIKQADVDDFFKKTFYKYDSKLWNKVVVNHRGKVDKNIILIHINRQLFKRTLFVPCYYESKPKFDVFYLYENFEALNALVNNNLTMTIPLITTEIKFELHLQCADWVDGHVNWRKKINYAVQKRLKRSNLNLDEFSGDSDLNDNLIVTMSSIAVLNYVLKIALELSKNIVVMTARQNKITTVEGFRILKDFHELKSLDLSDNYIDSFDTFPILPSVIEVFVDGNPFCVKFYNAPWLYIEEMMRFFPNLEYIDGRRIDKLIQIVPLQNFLVSRSAYSLTETFIKRFFEIYDSRSRRNLKNFYSSSSSSSSNSHPISMFSTSTIFTKKPNNNKFDVASRNLLSNKEVDERELFIGSKNIVDFFESLPESNHDFPTMCIDVSVMNEQNVLIHINGFFKEEGRSLNDNEILFKFSRTFFLERLDRVKGTLQNTFEFIIKNELLQVQRIEADEPVKAFKQNVIAENEIDSLCCGLTPSMSQAREANVLILAELTNLQTPFCKRLLQDVDWDIEVAIQHFLALIERNFFSEENFRFRKV